MADEIPILDGIAAVRRRPGMYLGTTGPVGLNHLVFELVGNGLDQFLGGTATTITVETSGRWARVSDDGDGMPFGTLDPRTGRPVVETLLTTMHVGASLDRHAPHVHRQMGVGLAPVNALCSELTVSSARHGERWEQTFVRGAPIAPERSTGPTTQRGTTVEFTADEEIFDQHEFDTDRLRAALFEDAHLYEGLIVDMNGERFRASNGLGSLLALRYLHNRSGYLPTDVLTSIRVADERLDLRFAMTAGADRARREYDILLDSWVNGRYMVEGGSHLDGAHEAFEVLQQRPRAAMMHLVMLEPEFAGPTRGRLDVPWTREAVRDLLVEALR